MVIVDTHSGPVSGIRLGDVNAWLGIPYAAPPVGALRFRAPEPIPQWVRPRQTVTFGAAAPQPNPTRKPSMPTTPLAAELMALLYPFSGSPVGGVIVDEDCLVLNVWAPRDSGPSRPVMVWFHGGAFVHGTGSEPAFWGDRLADRQDVVVVTVNHRLGALGYLPVESEGTGQAGMLDLVAALEWVHENIAAFGGDPANVTVFGQSGGGMKVATLMAMPAAAGLFHKAIVMSGPALQLPRLASSAPLTSALFGALGVEDGNIEALRSVPAEAIVDAQFAALAMSPAVIHGWAPIVDGQHIAGDPLSTVETSACHIPLLTGGTTEEAGMFLAMDPTYPDVDDSALHARLSADFGEDAEQALSSYRSAFPEAGAKEILRRIISDRDVRVSVCQFIERKVAASVAPAFSYLFDYNSGVLDGVIGATHSGELAFIFGNADRIPLSGERDDRDVLSAQMSSSFAAFARNGDPSVSGAPWQDFTEQHRTTMVYDGAHPHPVDDIDANRLALMSKYPSRLFPRS